MNNQWMNMSVLALSLSAITTTLYAEDQTPLDQVEQVQDAEQTLAVESDEAAEAPSVVVEPSSVGNGVNQAATALQQQEGDASQETNLQEVFTSSERQYSLIKKGVISSYYDIDYTYYRDSRIDASMEDGSLNNLRVEEDANHTLTNTFTLQYGLLDNVTLSASLPFMAKKQLLDDKTAAGLGDISFGARWEPFPLKQGRLPLIVFGSLSTKTGDSPYEIAIDELSTGKGYYSVGGGVSTRKYIDPVVLFTSVSASYGFKESGLNQIRGGGNSNETKGPRILESFDPGISGGFAFGFAYSFNYDVSLTMSYQQSFNTGAQFYFKNGESFKSADQSSSMLSFALGVRVSPATIVNGTVGIGLTEDAPDVSLGLSFPLDIIGFGKKLR
ncbi:hypothetical protein [Acinetobacter sp. NIPH 2699]|uniref:putative pilus system protein FilC n=1 Tax=Acinetobacter sp. NIPH 2699 TaxID=2923433 RepID=UPI001F4C4D46|nr:hypothetical protein [Acinetobacter sp. NIPH 2699]MCH7337775.1 hypothetical protein [Acinetobacter sp. NIPH 2699]